MKPTFCIGIATYNNPGPLRTCLEAVCESDDIERCEIVIVNNGTPESLVGVAPDGMKVGIVQKDSNVGVGAAYNEALQYCHAPYFVTLNDDLVVKDRGWLGKMRQRFLDDPKVAAVGVMTPGTCFRIDQNGLGCQGQPGDELEYVEGCCMMVRANVVRRIEGGLFDPVYRFGYFEDNDLSLRLRKQGYAIAAVPFEVEHGRASTTQRVIAEGVDVDGFHLYNQEKYKTRWRGYLRKRSFDVKVAIRRTGAIGDVIFLTPVLREIKRRNAHARITVYTDCPDALRDNPDVIKTLPSDQFSPGEYDRTIDLDGAYERRPGKHIIDAYGEVCGLGDIQDKRTYVNPGKEAREWWNSRDNVGRYAVIHPHTGQRWLGRNPGTTLIQQVCRHLMESGWEVVIVGAKASTAPIPCDMDLRGQTTLRQAFAVVERASLFFGVDSALMNVAQASLIPTVGIFGCMNPKNILLPHPFVTALTANPSKVGCLACHTNYGVQPAGSPGRCMRDRDICMEQIELSDAIKMIDHVVQMMMPYGETTKIRSRAMEFCQGNGIEIGCGRDPLSPDILTVDDGHWPEVKVQADGRKLPYSDGSFDFLYSSHAIEDIDDTEGVIKEWVRVVRTGGRVVIATPEPGLFTGCNMEHVWPGFTPEELGEYVRVAGCELEVADVWGDYSTVVVGRKL